MANAADQLPAVALAGAPADAPGFEQDHRKAMLGELQRSVDPRQAAADHADICAQLAFERGVGRRAACGGSVVGRGVLGSRHGSCSAQRLDLILLRERVMTRMILGLGVLETYSLSSTSWDG